MPEFRPIIGLLMFPLTKFDPDHTVMPFAVYSTRINGPDTFCGLPRACRDNNSNAQHPEIKHKGWLNATMGQGLR
jgi:hypothetical protein